MRRLLYLFYIGTYLARMHLSGYIASFLNSVLWFIIVFGPAVLFSPDAVKALQTFLPGLLGMMAASASMWIATEFLRWYVYQGLTDMFRECGLNVLHYLVAGMHIDLIIHNVLIYFAMVVAAALYIGADLSYVLPSNPWLFILAVAMTIPTYLLCGALTAYLFTVTPIGGVWTNILQMVLIIGTVVPPTIVPEPRILFINPAMIVAELARASYGTNIIDLNTLLIATPILAILYTLLSYIVAQRCEKHIAKYGLRYRV